MDNLKLSPICTGGANTSEKTNVTLPFEDEKTEAQKDDIRPPQIIWETEWQSQN